jgi:hypothetical protein
MKIKHHDKFECWSEPGWVPAQGTKISSITEWTRPRSLGPRWLVDAFEAEHTEDDIGTHSVQDDDVACSENQAMQ